LSRPLRATEDTQHLSRCGSSRNFECCFVVPQTKPAAYLHPHGAETGIERPKEPARTNVVNLMDALRRSVGQEKRTPASAKKGRKRIAGQTEMLLPIAGKKGKEVAAARPAGRRKRTG